MRSRSEFYHPLRWGTRRPPARPTAGFHVGLCRTDRFSHGGLGTLNPMRTPDHFPRRIVEIENAWIPLSDGTRLAARIWLPDDASADPVPAVLEYLPYRKDDANASQDATRHPYFAGHGYAAVRVDLRGTGDSDGILCDEYLKQEQDDALEVLSWLGRQPWCTGAVGMIGYSWGGFNGLQVAARRPPQLKAIVTMYSTDDRYRDDCHYMGGCLLGSDMLKWATWMRAYNALPPDPRFREDWREEWLHRLEHTPAFIEPWMSHTTYDEFWKQGSVAEEYAAIEAATLVVGGWTDAYTNAVPRLLQNLECERRGIIGPWGHVVPYRGVPGPAIGFLQECLRWFGRWLKDEPTGVESDPFLRVWIGESFAPAPFHETLPGRWTEQPTWPPPAASPLRLRLGAAGVLGGEQLASAAPAARLELTGAQECGETGGVWCVNGRTDEMPIDQRADDARSACFDTPPLEAPLEVLGFPVLHLTLSSDRPKALVAARLCEVTPDGASTLVSWGLLNLAHPDGFETVRLIDPGVEFTVAVQLNAIGHRFSEGNRLRLAVSPTQWPHAWPSPHAATITLALDGPCALELPVLSEPGEPLATAFESPEALPPGAARHDGGRTRERSVAERVHTIHDHEWSEEFFSVAGTAFSTDAHDIYAIAEGDPLSARTTSTRETRLGRDGWHVRVSCEATMTSDAHEFVVDDSMRAWDGDDLIFDRTVTMRFPRGAL